MPATQSCGPSSAAIERDLDWRERAVVVVALDARQRGHQVPVADHESIRHPAML